MKIQTRSTTILCVRREGRVALGGDLPALFCNDESLAADLLSAADRRSDPMWRLPLWQPYTRLLRSQVADTSSTGEGGFAGAILAGLFVLADTTL